MSDQDHESLFKELDGNTLFTAAYSWLYEDDKTGRQEAHTAIGTWAWEDVQSVQTMDARTFPEMAGPRCALFAVGGYLYLRADYQTVLRAWRRYRLAYGSRHLRFTTEN